MMTVLILFRPRHELDAEANAVDFIDMARNQLSVFGKDLDFDVDTWDATEWLNIKCHGAKRQRIVFDSWRVDENGNSVPLDDRFRPFAKAYIRYMQGLRPTKLVAQRLAALRAIESALLEGRRSADPSKICPSILNRACQLLAERYSQTTAYRVSQQLNAFANFISRHKLTHSSFAWRSFIHRPRDGIRVGKEFDERRKKKLPTEASVDALGRIFCNAETPRDILISGIAALLCASPDRISEVLSLPADCEFEQKLPNGKVVYGLRWRPSKDAPPMIKWVIPSMTSVVKKALSRIRKITNSARIISEWYERYPDSLYLPPGLEHLRDRKYLSSEELRDLLRLAPRGHISFCRHHKIPYTGRGLTWKVRFSDLEDSLLSRLPAEFPFVSKELNLRFSEALFVLRKNELHVRRATMPVIIEALDINRVNSELGGRSSSGIASVFSRMGLKEEDGAPIRVSTHRFRHLLNTAAHMAGMSNLDIAKWSGRIDIRQNTAYNHMTVDQMLALARDAVGDQGKMIGPLADVPSNLPITREQFAQLRMPTGHVTELGVCVHDFTMSPCSRHRDCIQCEELICIKGDLERNSMIRSALQETVNLLRQAEEAVEQGFSGSRRWYEHHLVTVERLSSICAALENPAVPDGAVLHLRPVGEAQPRPIIWKELKRIAPDGW
ncbi:integrase [Herbaspirillum seropedicae]|uniref:integrase n=1 Tax=Herbaspirillum seropedicae TaxID=964 RepID=UPI0012E9B1F7|nr:integrase [Herbaspirillum seropedicae]